MAEQGERRLTIRINSLEAAELQRFKTAYGLKNDGEAYKVALATANLYLTSVTDLFIPKSHNLILLRKTKNEKPGKVVY